jgi:hypothetical protein
MKGSGSTMGLLSGWKSKRGRGEVPAEPVPAPPNAPPAAPRALPTHDVPLRVAPKGPGLRDEVAEIASRGLEREQFAAAVVERIVSSSTIEAAALLAYQQRDNRLSVAASSGLSPAAIAILAGETSEEGQGRWDIPLRGLLSRRINVIEAAHENPFVPQALKEVSPRRLTIVTIPFYHGPNPVGAALIFVPLDKGLSDLRLQQLTQAMRLCAPSFAEVDGIVAAPPIAQPKAGAPGSARKRLPAGVGEELARLKMALEEAERQRSAEAAERVTAESFLQVEREKTAAALRELAEVRAEVERIRSEVGEAQARAADAATQEASERAAAEARAALERAKNEAREAIERATAEGKQAAEHAAAAARGQAEKVAEEALAAARAESERIRGERDAAVSRAERAQQGVEELARVRKSLEAELAEARADAAIQGKEAKALAKVRTERHAIARELETVKAALEAAGATERRLAEEAQAAAKSRADAETNRQRIEKETAERIAQLEQTIAAERETQKQLRGFVEKLEREAAEVRERAEREASSARGASNTAADLEKRLAESDRERKAAAELAKREAEAAQASAAAVADLEKRLKESERERQAAAARADKEGEAARATASAITELERLLTESDEARRSLTERLSGLDQSELERTRLAGIVPELERGVAERQASLDRLAEELTARSAEIDRLRGEHASALEAGEQERRAASEAFEALRRETAAELDRVRAEARAEIDSVRGAAAGEHERLRGEAAAESERLRGEAATERDALRAELAAAAEARALLEGELARFREAAEETRRELESERAARGEAAAELQRAIEDRLAATRAAEATAAALRQELEAASGRIAALDQSTVEANAANERLRMELEAAHADRERRLGEERTAREQALGDAAGRLAAVERETEERLATLEKESQEQRAALEREAAERLAAIEGESAQRLTAETEARRALEARIASLEAESQRERAEWAATLEQAEGKIVQLELLKKDAEEAYETELAQLRQTLAERDEEVAEAAHAFVLEELVESVGDEIEIDRSSASGNLSAEPLPEPPPAPLPPARPRVVLFDDTTAGSAAAIALDEPERGASAVPPGPAGLEAMKSAPGAVLGVNLASALVWPTLRQLRSNGLPQPSQILAYAIPNAAPSGFWLGPVGFALLPLAELDVAAMVRAAAPGAKRVIAMSGDTDLMGEVRARLSAAKMSTAVVFDGRQALDLVPTVRPEAAIVHLAPSCGDVFSAVVGFRNLEAARNIPIFFLLDSAPQQREEAFFATGLRLLSTRANLQAGELGNQLARAMTIPARAA